MLHKLVESLLIFIILPLRLTIITQLAYLEMLARMQMRGTVQKIK